MARLAASCRRCPIPWLGHRRKEPRAPGCVRGEVKSATCKTDMRRQLALFALLIAALFVVGCADHEPIAVNSLEDIEMPPEGTVTLRSRFVPPLRLPPVANPSSSTKVLTGAPSNCRSSAKSTPCSRAKSWACGKSQVDPCPTWWGTSRETTDGRRSTREKAS
jgi:hypothetical protein